MTTAAIALNRAARTCAVHDGPEAPSAGAARLFVETAFRAAGKPVPSELDGRAFLQAQFLTAGKPIPSWLAGHAARAAGTRVTAPTRQPTVDELAALVGKVDGALDAYAASKGMRFVEVPDEPRGPLYSEPTPWDVANANEDDLLPTLRELSDEQAAKLQAEAVELRAFVADVNSPFRERTRASARLAAIEAKLRAAGRWTELGRGGVLQPQPRAAHADADRFPDAKNPDGDPLGDERVMARRRETRINRELTALRKQLHAAARGSAAKRERIEEQIREREQELAEVTREILKGGAA